uniref:Dipeptidylpeptidase IV N-terminal domain-containing protein n=1 Tax=Setaria italica TaxID=4555 RepID=K3ZNP8_SETIT
MARYIADGVSRGSIATLTPYRPALPLDIFSCPIPPSSSDGENNEISLTDGVSYNHNCRSIPAVALNALIAKKPELASECGATADDVDNGRATGLVFVSERDGGLETLHVALRCNGKVKVLSLADIYGADNFGGVRMEDTGGFGTSFVGHYADLSIIYVSTKTRVGVRRTPWTAVYRTNLRTGETKRLTPDGQSDLSPAVSPSGTRVAVASFQSGWTGEIEHLKTDIVLMNVDRYASGGSLDRKPIVNDGGWPSWGSDNIIFFHRGIEELEDPASGRSRTATSWGVFRYDLSTMQIDRVTPTGMDAMTPAAISETKVAVATIRSRTNDYFMTNWRGEEQYRHIEIFDVSSPDQPPVKITQNIFTDADYYSPFVLNDGSRIGYHRVGRDTMIQKDNGNSNVPRIFDNMQSPHVDVKLFRVSSLVPSFSADGSKFAFVRNDMKNIWIADKQRLCLLQVCSSPTCIFSLVWNQNPDMDTLYACVVAGANRSMHIKALSNVSSSDSYVVFIQLTKGDFFNAYPSTNPEGTKVVFQSTRDHGDYEYKNLYIMEDAQIGEFGEGSVTRLTNGPWIDTQCQWSPRGNWIVFSSTRDKPAAAPENYNELDPGHFAIYLVNAADPTVVVRVVTSGDPGPGASSIAGHVNHPVFSPDGRSIAFTSDIAAVSAEPISMPMASVMASVRPYGDIFSVDIDPDDICRNKDIDRVHRVTHSRYEYSTNAWTKLTPTIPRIPLDHMMSTM